MKQRNNRGDIRPVDANLCKSDEICGQLTCPGSNLNTMPSPIRILTAVPICDGHDSAINTINLEFIRHGIEVIYLGYHRPVADIVRAAIQEDVRAIGISSYNGGHIEFFADVVGIFCGKKARTISRSSAAAAARSRMTTPQR